MPGRINLSQGERGAEWFYSQEQGRKQRAPVFSHRRMLYEEEDETVWMRWRMVALCLRPRSGVRSLVGGQVDEVMHQVWTRHRPQREERNDSCERDAALVQPMKVPLTWLAAGPESVHKCRFAAIAHRYGH